MLTIDGNGTDTIDGAATLSIASGDSVLLQVSTTTKWKIRARSNTGAGGGKLYCWNRIDAFWYRI